MIKTINGFMAIVILSSNVFAGCYETAQTGWYVGLGIRGGATSIQNAENLCRIQISSFQGDSYALQIAYEACVAATSGGTLDKIIMKHCH
jgi:hypothetical protein